MNKNSLRQSLRLSATLLLLGQLLYILITLFHTGGEANNHPAIFAAYGGDALHDRCRALDLVGGAGSCQGPAALDKD